MPKLKSAQRNFPQISLLLSTDIAGILAMKPQLFYQLFHTLTADCGPIDGVEFLPFRLSSQKMLQALQVAQIPILGIHGPVGWQHPQRSWTEKLYVALFSILTTGLSTTLSMTASTQPKYLLFHEPDLDYLVWSQKITQFLQKKPVPPLLLENVYRPHSLQLSADKAKQLCTQAQAGVMIDLVHLLMEVEGVFSSFTDYRHALSTKNIDSTWQKMLFAMDLVLEQLAIAGLHLPLGTNRDSLPWELLTSKHWQELAQLINKHQKRLIAITLENQHLETILTLTASHLPMIIKDKKMKIKTLLAAGVL